jgi:hypothetical protein
MKATRLASANFEKGVSTMAHAHNSIAGRSETLTKRIGEAWMLHFAWIEAIELAHEQRVVSWQKPLAQDLAQGVYDGRGS